MSQEQVQGGAGPAIAAHSKDGSTPGQTAASAATGNESGQSHHTSETISGVAGQAREAAGRLGASLSGAAATARQSVAEGSSRTADQATAFVRDQPFLALALTGGLCLAIGILLGRR